MDTVRRASPGFAIGRTSIAQPQGPTGVRNYDVAAGALEKQLRKASCCTERGYISAEFLLHEMGKKKDVTLSPSKRPNLKTPVSAPLDEDALPTGERIVSPKRAGKRATAHEHSHSSSLPPAVEAPEAKPEKKHKKSKKSLKEAESAAVEKVPAAEEQERSKKHKKEKKEKHVPATEDVKAAQDDADEAPKEKKEKKSKKSKKEASTATASQPSYALGDLSRSLFGDSSTVPEAALFSAIPEAPARAAPVSSEEEEESKDDVELPDDEDEELARLRKAGAAEDEDEEENEDGEKEKDKKDKDEKHTKEKLARTVFVGNVPVTTDRKALKKLFKDYGTVESVRLRSVALAKESLSNYRKAGVLSKQFHPARSTCNAYVVFSSRAEAEEALELNNYLLEDKHLHVDLADATNKYEESDLCVFVGNLPFDAEDEDMRTHFAACGDIEYVRLVRDKETNVGKGIGYVKFKDRDGVASALLLNGHQFKNRELRVFSAKSRKVEPKRNARGRDRGRGADRGRGRGASSPGRSSRGGLRGASAPQRGGFAGRGRGGSTRGGGSDRGGRAGRGRGGFAAGFSSPAKSIAKPPRQPSEVRKPKESSSAQFEGKRAEPGVLPRLKKPAKAPHKAAKRPAAKGKK